MTTNSQPSTTEPKKKQRQKELSKQLEQEQIHRNGDHMEGYQWGRGGRNWGQGTGNKQHIWQVENRQGEDKHSIGNVEAKELICTTHGRELRWGVVCRLEWNKGGKMGQL